MATGRKPSFAERAFIRAAKKYGLSGYVTEYRVVVEEKVYYLDFAWPKKKLYCEIDGKQHLLKEALKYDKLRDSRMKGLGWTCIRILFKAFRKRPEFFIKKILKTLNK
jgi:very-short-patch-repair endonuclease